VTDTLCQNVGNELRGPFKTGPIRCAETLVKNYGALGDGTDTLSRNVGKELRGPLEMGPIRCPQPSVKNYEGPLRRDRYVVPKRR
jgi:hypothetical protein